MTHGFAHDTFLIEPPSQLQSHPSYYCHLILMQQSLFVWVNSEPVLEDFALSMRANRQNSICSTQLLCKHQTPQMNSTADQHSMQMSAKILQRLPQLRQVYCSCSDAILSLDQCIGQDLLRGYEAMQTVSDDNMARDLTAAFIPPSVWIECAIINRVVNLLQNPTASPSSMQQHNHHQQQIIPNR